jgi:uncharacterized membrane protein
MGRVYNFSAGPACMPESVLVQLQSEMLDLFGTGIGLLAVTLLKLFLHDLANIDSGYRIGALIAVAIIALVASFLYQRFLTDDKSTSEL